MEYPFLQSCLMDGEKLLWSGSPARRFRIQHKHLPLFFVALPFLAFLLIAIWGAFDSNTSTKTDNTEEQSQRMPSEQTPHPSSTTSKVGGIVFVVLFGVGIVGCFATSIGVAFGNGHIFAGPKIYGVTDKRIIVVAGRTQKLIQSLALQTHIEIRMQEWPDGLGTISFGPKFAWPYANSMADTSTSLENIKEPRIALQVILQAVKN